MGLTNVCDWSERVNEAHLDISRRTNIGLDGLRITVQARDLCYTENGLLTDCSTLGIKSERYYQV